MMDYSVSNLPKKSGRYPWKKGSEKTEDKEFWDPQTGYYTVIKNGKVHRYVSEKEYLETQKD